MIKSSRVLFAILCFAGMVVSTAAQTSVTTTGGTPNAVPKFTGSSSIGNSTIIESGGSVGIGTTAPSHPLDVQGYSGTTQTNVATFLNGTNGAYTSIDAAGNSSSVPSWNDGAEILEFVPYSAGNGIVSAFTGNLLFQTNSRTTQMSILPNGNVGIGNVSPDYKLDVNGSIRTTTGIYFPNGSFQNTAATGTITGVLPGSGLTGGGYSGSVSLSLDGTVPRTNAVNYYDYNQVMRAGISVAHGSYLQNTLGNDVVEAVCYYAGGYCLVLNAYGNLSVSGYIYATDFVKWAALSPSVSPDTPGPGDLLAIDPGGDGTYTVPSTPYSTMVAGVYASVANQPNVADGAGIATYRAPVITNGIALCKVTDENGPIQAGDLLVSSSTRGFAMRGTDKERLLGAVVGKAAGSLASGKGAIKILVTLQ